MDEKHVNRLSAGVLASVLFFLACLATPAAVAQVPPPNDAPINLIADEMTYDKELGVVTARGNVEINQLDRILRADTITYNQRQDVLSASGKVSLLEPTGDVLFAEFMELTGDFKEGVIRDLRIILSDTSRIAANSARRTGGETTTMSQAVYSPCDLCKDDPSRPPLWQVKAMRVIHDQPSHMVEYKDAWLEVAGIPVAYTPYLTHPDPTVKRQSGFLAPSLGNSSALGAILETPYFWAISPSSDFTFSPRFTSKEGPILAGEYRQRFLRGSLATSASITEDSDDDVRGHIRSTGRFDQDATWRVGYDIDRSSDDTYLRRYGNGSSNDTLTSRLYREGFRGGNYASMSAYAFQGLRAQDTHGQTPYVLPYMTYNHVGETDHYGGRTEIDSSLVALTRTDGTDTRRLSVVSGWNRPFTTNSGHLFNFSTSLIGQAYHVDELTRPNDTEFSGATGRLIPEMAFDWRFPMIRDEGITRQVVEPLGSFVVSPNGGNPVNIPNEDSLDFEFDDTNLFSPSRFTGVDRMDGGARVNYGIKWGIFGENGGSTSVLFGQSFRPRTDDTFSDGSGVEDNFSDLVGRLIVQPTAEWSLFYRGRWDKDNYENRRSELSTVIGPRNFSLSIDYLLFNRPTTSELPGREEIRFGLNVDLTRYWRISTGAIRDLGTDGGLRSAQLGLIYEDECFVVRTDFRRNYFRDRDLEPEDVVLVQLVFKTLGDFNTSLF